MDNPEGMRTEAALRQSEEKYRTLFETIDEGFCIIEVLFEGATAYDYRFLEANPAFERHTGLVDVIGKTIREMVPLHDAHWFERYGQIALSGAPARFENSADALGRCYDVYAFRIGEPEAHQVAVLFNDITHRKRQEANLKFWADINANFAPFTSATEIMERIGERLAQHLRLSRCSFSVVDLAQDRITTVYDWRREQSAPSVLGEHHISTYITPQAQQQFVAGQLAVINDVHKDPSVNSVDHLTNNLKITAIVNAPYLEDGEWKFLLSACHDHVYQWHADEVELLRELSARIHAHLERTHAELALRESEQRLKQIADAMPQLVWIADADGHVHYYNQRVTEFAGVTRGKDGTWRWQAIVHPDDLAATQRAWDTAAASQRAYSSEHRMLMANGQYRWHLSRATLAYSRDGQDVRWFGTATDIHDLKVAEEKLAKANTRFQMAEEAAGSFSFEWDVQADTVTRSDALKAVLGYEVGDLAETWEAWVEIMHPDYASLSKAEAVDFINQYRQKTFGREYPVRHKDGHYCWVYERATIVRNEQGQARYLIGQTINISERKRLEEQVQAQYDELSTLYRSAPIGLALMDTELRFTRINERLAAINGVSIERHLGHRVREIVPDLADQAEAILQKILITGEPALNIELEGETAAEPNVRRIWNESWHPLKDSTGQVFAISIVVEDITDRKQAQRQLRAAHDTFRHLVENSPFGVYAVDADFRLVQVSKGAQKVFENVRPLIGRDFAEVMRILWTEPFASEAIGHFRHTLTTGEAYQAPSSVLQRHDIDQVESYDWKIERIVLPDGRYGVVCNFYDLSERQRYEAALREREAQLQSANERFRIAEEASNGFIYDLDLVTGVENRSEGFMRLLGYGANEVIGGRSAWEGIMHPDDVLAVRTQTELLINARDRDASGTRYEYRLRDHQGNWHWVLDENVVIRNDVGEAQRIVGSIIDITERKHTEDALRQSERRFRELANAMPQIVWTHDASAQINYVNQQWIDFTGSTFEEVLRERSAILHADDRESAQAVWQTCVQSGQNFEQEFRLRRHDGAYRWHLARSSPVRNLEGQITGWYGTATDIHDRKQGELDTQFIADLSGYLNAKGSEDNLIWHAQCAVAKHLDAVRAGFNEVDMARNVLRFHRDFCMNVASIAGEYPMAHFGEALNEEMRAGKIVVIRDTQMDERTAMAYASRFEPAQLRAVLSVPLLRGGNWVASLWIGTTRPRQWETREIDVLRTVAERAWLAIESARLQAATEHLNATLERHVTERTAELRESQSQLRKLSVYTERSLENERARIARDVHDEIGGALTALKMSVMWARKGREADTVLAEKVSDWRHQIDDLVNMVRRIASDLRPPLLDDFGLIAALEWQSQDWSRRTGIPCQVVVPEYDVMIERDSRTAVYRVFQEALTNIARHANASEVIVNVILSDEQLLLSIKDNGCGIPTEALRPGKSLGLLGMRERIREVSGSLSIIGVPNAGTTVTINLPIRNVETHKRV